MPFDFFYISPEKLQVLQSTNAFPRKVAALAISEDSFPRINTMTF